VSLLRIDWGGKCIITICVHEHYIQIHLHLIVARRVKPGNSLYERVYTFCSKGRGASRTHPIDWHTLLLSASTYATPHRCGHVPRASPRHRNADPRSMWKAAPYMYDACGFSAPPSRSAGKLGKSTVPF
jgi:hypothetical protein